MCRDVPQMSIWQMETLDGWEEIMMINTLGCSNYGYWAKIRAGANDTSTVTTDLQLDPFWEVDQMAFECNRDKSRGLGWLAVMFCVSVVLLGGMVLPTVLIGVISLGFDEAALKIKLENKGAYALDHITWAAAEWNGRVTERQMECMRVIFEMIDFDSQGDISRGEFLPLLEMLCKRWQLKCFNDELLSDMFDVVSVSGNGSLSFPEFFWLMLFLKHQLSSRDRSWNDAEERKALDAEERKTLDCTIGAELVCASLFDEEANSLDKEKKPVDDSLPLASLAPIHETAVEAAAPIQETAVLLDVKIGCGLSDDDDDDGKKETARHQTIGTIGCGLINTDDNTDDEDRNDAGNDIDTTGSAVDCSGCQRTRVSPSVEGDFDDESFQKLINVLHPLASLASGLQPAADQISDPKARAGLLSLLGQLTSLPAMPRNDLHTLLQQTDIVSQAITATGRPPRRPQLSKKQRKRSIKKNVVGNLERH